MGGRMALKGKRRKGQLRIVELVVAISMVVSVILLVMHFTRPMRSVYLREVSDLRRLAYNLINNFAEAGVFERILDAALSGDRGWEGRLRIVVVSSLPSGIVFRMEIYRANASASGEVSLERLDTGAIANLDSDRELLEAESVHYTHVCVHDPDRVRGEILYIVLMIGYAG